MASRFFLFASIAPLSSVTVLDLRYQLYLNHIFHRTPLAFYGHAATMPCVNLFLMALAHQHQCASLLLCGLALWYWAWGLRCGVWWMGPGAVPVLLFAYWGGYYYLRFFQISPLYGILLFSSLQCWSHLLEDLPPRITTSDKWTSLSQILRAQPHLLHNVLRIGLQVLLLGPLNEFVASPRLLPLYWSILPGRWILSRCTSPSASSTLRLLLKWDALFQACLSSSQPAIDYVGVMKEG